jgi:2-dehydro-3-deoxyglucarate aldolase/4-hydroxy-2-oxoheptanedioate aldolase
MVMEFASRGIAKIIDSAGVDFALYDMEHSGFSMDRVFDLIAWSKSASFAPMVRVPQGRYHFIARVLDAGALGIMVANVETAEQAREIVSFAKYPPEGRRGVALGTAHNDYVMPSPPDYLAEANKSTVVICQIESESGVRNADAIAATPGVDCLWIGHFDLSTSLGIPGDFAHERFLAARSAVVEAAQHHGKLLGVQPGSIEMAKDWIAAGFNAISWSSDIAVYKAALLAGVATVRELG